MKLSIKSCVGRAIAFSALTVLGQSCETQHNFTEVQSQALLAKFTTPRETLLSASLGCDLLKFNLGHVKFKILTLPIHGELKLINELTGKITYLPEVGFTGNDRLDYTCEVTNGKPQTTQNKTEILVTPVNYAPVADRATFQMNALESLEIDLTNKVTDRDNSVPELRCTADADKQPAHGTVEVIDSSRCLLRYTPAPDFRGTELFGYQVFDPSNASGKNTIDVTVGNPLRHMKPALAVRAAGCLTCHTSGQEPNVKNSNVITDFGYGSPWFWAAGSGQPGFNDFTQGISGGANPPPANPSDAIGFTINWGSVQIVNGNVIVPKDARIAASAIGQVSDPGWANVSFSPKDYLSRQALNGASTANPRFTVAETSKIVIGSPTADQIRAGGNDWIPGTKTLKFIKQNNQATDLSGLRAVGTGSSLYYLADSSAPIVCSGDVVIDAPVWLNQTTVQTGDLGCRIYSTASIFVTGALPIIPINADTTHHNLQLASSRGIFMGLGRHDGYEDGPGRGNSAKSCAQINIDSLRLRLGDSRFGNRLRIATTDTDWENYKTAVFADEDLMPELNGACIVPAYKDISFERLLLNAPYIGGRYDKPFKGSMIGEVISWLPGKFAFEFDPVFEVVPVLPLIDFANIFDIGEVK